MSGWLEDGLRELLAMHGSEQQAVLDALSEGHPLAGPPPGLIPAAGPGRRPPESDGGLQQAPMKVPLPSRRPQESGGGLQLAPMKVPLPADRGSGLVPQEGLYAEPMCQQPRSTPRALPLQHGEDDCSQLVQSITSAMKGVFQNCPRGGTVRILATSPHEVLAAPQTLFTPHADASAPGRALQQRAGTSEQRAWTESFFEAPTAAGPPMHARQHAAGWWAAGPIAGLPPRTSSRRGPSSGADAVASPVRAGSNRKADGSTPWSGKVTTVMVRNLPPTLKRQDFWRELDATGFCYIPRDFTSGRCQGHAFLNFKEAADASRFRVVWHNTERFGCRDPLVDVSPARIQGYEANAREANSSRGRNKVRNPHFRSLIKVQDADPPPPRGLQSAGSVPSGWAAADAEGPRKAWSKRQAQASRRASAEESATQQAGMALERGGSNQQRRP